MHDHTRALEIADNIAILDNGKIIFHGSARDTAEGRLIKKIFDVKACDCDGLKIYR